ncbi:MAG: AraC family transcriptional regulator [Actinomycetota bacterium]
MGPFEVRYREFPPSSLLAPWVACSWELSVGRLDAPYCHRVLPDGCMDRLWSPAGLQVAGPNTTAFLATLPPGGHAAGVRLHPGGAGPLLGVAAPALLDAHVWPRDLWGTPGARLADAVDGAASAQARRGLLVSWLAERSRSAAEPDRLVRAVTRRLEVRCLSVHDLAGELGYSERHLQRRIVSQVGYGPKRLARNLSLRRALAAAGDSAGPAPVSLARVAYESGYADQAHFSNECLALAGVPPTMALAG